MLNNSTNYLVKEFANINNHYIKLEYINKDIHIVAYNTLLFNGIKYETKIAQNEIAQKYNNNNFTNFNLFELIAKKIGENKYVLKSDQKFVVIVLLESGQIFGLNKNIQIVIPINNNHSMTDYEKLLIKEINKLKEANNKLLIENNELRDIIKKNNISVPLNNQQSSQLKNSSQIINQKQSIINLNSSQNQIENLSKSKAIINNKASKTSSLMQPKGDQSIPLQNPDLNLSILSNLTFKDYPPIQLSPNPFSKIIGYGANSYNGIVRDHNEDRIKIVLDYKINKQLTINNKIYNPNISYFAIYDGHGGNGCTNFLQENLHTYIFNSDYFPLKPLDAIYQAYERAEQNFTKIAFDYNINKLIDKSGSCSLSALIIDDICYMTYLGDSRGIYSYDSGNQLFQVTRDHKPNNPIEVQRIQLSGGKIYKDTRLKVNGVKIKVNEKDAPGVNFPFRVYPGNLSVARSFGDLSSKEPLIGGLKGTIISKPCVNKFQINEKSDFLLLGCDGIFDTLSNDDIFKIIWGYKKKGKIYEDIRQLCGKIADGIIKYSMQKQSIDNVTVIFIAFKNFEKKMKEPDFEYVSNVKTKQAIEQYDFSRPKIIK